MAAVGDGGRATFVRVGSGRLFSLALLYWHYSITYHIMIPVLQLWITRRDSPLVLFPGVSVLYIRAGGSRKTPNPDTWIRTSFLYTIVGTLLTAFNHCSQDGHFTPSPRRCQGRTSVEAMCLCDIIGE